MSFVNSYIENIRPYTVASHKIWAVPAEERGKILKLDWNESTVEPSPRVRAALEKRMAENGFFYLYPSTYNEGLMHAMSAYLGLPEENLQYFGGSDSLHEYLVRVYLKEGDRALLLWPSYDNFRLTAESAGAVLSYSEMSQDFVFSLDRLKTDIARTEPKMVYLCNPNNPTGNLIPRKDVAELLNAFPACMFLIDEAYMEFAGGESAKDEVLTHGNVLICRTLSKAFGLANLRFGYLAASRENIQAVSKIRNPKNIPTFSQDAAQAALEDTDYARAHVAEVVRAREMFRAALLAEPFSRILTPFPTKSNFLLLRLRRPEDKPYLLQFLADRNIFVRNVSQSESLRDCLRVTIGTTEQMERVLDAFRLAFEGRIG